MNNKEHMTPSDHNDEVRYAYELSFDTLYQFMHDMLEEKEAQAIEAYLQENPEQQQVLEGMKLLAEQGQLDALVPDDTEIERLIKKREQLRHNQPFSINTSLEALTAETISNAIHVWRPPLSLEEDLKQEEAIIRDFNIQLLKKRTLPEAYAYICKMTKKLLNGRTASIFLYSKEGQLTRRCIFGVKNPAAFPKEVFRPGQGFVGTAAIGDEKNYGNIRLCNQMQAQDYLKEDPVLCQYLKNHETALTEIAGKKEVVQHVIVAPLNAFHRSAGVLRVVNKVDPSGRQILHSGFSEQDKRRLQLIAALASLTIAYLKNEERNAVLNEMPKLLEKHGQEEVLNQIAKSLINESTLYTGCVIRVIDEHKRNLVIKGASMENLDPEIIKIKIGEGITGNLLYANEPVKIEALQVDPKGFTSTKWALSHGFASVVSFPLKSADRAISLGSLSVYTSFVFDFSGDDIKYLEQFVQRVAELLEGIAEDREQKLLKELSDDLLRDSQIERLMYKVSKQLPLLTGFDKCRFILKEKDCFRIITQRKYTPEKLHIPLNNEISKQIQEEPGCIRYFWDVKKSEVLQDAGLQPFLKGIKGLVLIPISSAEEELYGFVALSEMIHHQVSEKQLDQLIDRLMSKLNEDMLWTIVNQFATAISKINKIESKEMALKEAFLEQKKAKNEAEMAHQVIKDQYETYKSHIKVLGKSLIQETKRGTKAHFLARLLAANLFVGKELLIKYLSKQSLKSESMTDASFDFVFDEHFSEILTSIPKALGESASIVLKINEGDSIYKFNKQQIQDIILSLVMNALDHRKSGKESTIFIETIGPYLSVKNDRPRTPEDIQRLKKLIRSKEYQNEGTTLFTIDKYFKQNYQENIQIDCNEGHFIVELPFANQSQN